MGGLSSGLLQRKPDAEIGCNGYTAICTAVSRIVTPLHPGPGLKIVYVHVVKPDIGQVLPSNDEQPIGRNRRKMGVASLRNEMF